MALKVRLLLIFCLSAAPLVMADMQADCKSSEEHFKNVKVDGRRDWTKTDANKQRRIRVRSMPDDGEDSKAYAYCAAALASAGYENGDHLVAQRFSAKPFYEGFSTPQDVGTALSSKINKKVKATDKSGAVAVTIQKYCSRSFKANELELFRKVIMSGPACVEVTLPTTFSKDVYDCVADKDSNGPRQKFHALVYGIFNNDFDIQVFRGLRWGKEGHTRLKNADKCGLLDKVSYIGVAGTTQK